MRKRSTTIDAETEEEFLQKMKEQEIKEQSSLGKRRYKLLNQFPVANLYHEDIGLGAENNYKMLERQKSSEEKEKEDEDALNSNFQELNYFYKEGDTNEFLVSLSNLSRDSNLCCFNNSTTASNHSKEKENISFFKHLSVEISEPPNGMQNDSAMHSILAQNLEIFEQVVKIMILGDKRSGKSFFISKLLNKGEASSYVSTKSLEIHNKIMKVCGKLVKFEIFDTCSKILNDDLIKIYYKLSNAFIIIFANNQNSLNFAESQVDFISQNYPKKKILLLYNNYNHNPKSKSLNSEIPFSRFIGKYNSQIKEIDLKSMRITDPYLSSFFRTILLSQSPHKENSKHNSSKNIPKAYFPLVNEPESSNFLNRRYSEEMACKLEYKSDCIIL